MVKACYNDYMSVKRIEPIEIDKFFTEKEMDLVYGVIDAKIEKGLTEKNDPYAEMFKFSNNGFITSNRDWPKELIDVIKNKAEELGQGNVSYENIVLIFCRYTHDSGGAPNLVPHADVVVNKTMYTATVRLKSSKQWDFYVEDKKFDMGEYGSAVWFTGNQDVHWRPDMKFEPHEYYDILLCQAWTDTNNDLYPENHFDIMLEKQRALQEKYKDMLTIAGTEDKNTNTDCTGMSDGQTIEEAVAIAKEFGSRATRTN